jgi:hypothetical protein
MTIDPNDPRLEGYVPLQEFIDQDQDQTSRRIRDMPFGKHKESLQISTGSLAFADTGKDYESPSLALVLTNDGYGDLNIYGHELLGDFVLKSSVPAKILAGETATILVAFAPSEVGALTGSLYLDTGNASGDEFVELSGAGIISVPEVPPDELEAFIDARVDVAMADLDLAPVAVSGAYADLTGKPVLAPVATSGAYADLAGKPALAPVATSGAYADLAGKPVLAAVATSGAYADLTGKPALAPVATSGVYSDLTGKPTLGTAAALAAGTAAGNVPVLDGAGKIPAAVLPAYVDDVLEYANLAAFPVTGTAGLIYVTQDTNRTYRWSGSAYVEIAASPGSTDAVTEGATNKYYTDARVRAAVLTGLSLATGTAIAAADTVLSAFGKLQKQITDLTSTVSTFMGLARREVLTAARTYYVRADGNDSNSGLVNNSGGAFLTPQKAINVAAGLDTSIYDVTIQCGAGTYDIGNTGLVTKAAVGAGAIIILGDETTPSNVILRMTGTLASVGNPACLQSVNVPTIYKIRGFRLESTATGNAFGLVANGSTRVEFQNIDIGTGFLQQLRAGDGGVLAGTGPYTISGGCSSHWTVVGGAVVRVQATTVTFVGTLAIGVFASATTGAIIFGNSNTFAGTFASVTGQRYSSDSNAVISVAGAGATYLPGNAAGVVQNGGQYV